MASTPNKLTANSSGDDGLTLPITNDPHQRQSGAQSGAGAGAESRLKPGGLRIRDWVRPSGSESKGPSSEEAHHCASREQQQQPYPHPDPDPAVSISASDRHDRSHDQRRARPKHDPWWKIHLFRGMVNDIRKRAPFYLSDWTDAWNYRVVPATVYMFFANILPALAFSLDMFNKTGMQYGVNEVLLSSVLGAVVFSVLACQPLVIVGVTGPITVFNYTVYDIMMPSGTNYLAFMCWIGIWSLIFHWILAITNSCNWLRYVTRFPCDIFGFYVAFIYLQKGIQILETLGDGEPFYLSVVVALLVFAIAYICGELGQSSLFKHPVRVFLKDYGTPLTVVFFTGFVHMGKMRNIPLETLPTGIAFMPTVSERSWFVHFWDIPVGDIFVAIPFALLLTILFWFDHNVSSLIAQGTEFPLKKPAGFHWDLFLLGLTTGVAGLLGLPFPNGLIPQAPFHTESLCVTEAVPNGPDTSSSSSSDTSDRGFTFRAIYVVEQRLSNLAQGLLTLVAMTGPLLTVLHLIPQGVLAGLFFIMGFQALEANGITAKILFLARDAALTPAGHPLRRYTAGSLPRGGDQQDQDRGEGQGEKHQPRSGNNAKERKGGGIRRRTLYAFVLIELLGFGATFAITQTVAAVGFPVFIFLLIPLRAMVLPRWLSPDELAVLDAPTASPFTMESVGGSIGATRAGAGAEGGEGDDGAGEDSTGRSTGKEVDVMVGGGSGSGSGSGSGRRRMVGGDGDDDEDEEELAERGESRMGTVRRRLSTIRREDS